MPLAATASPAALCSMASARTASAALRRLAPALRAPATTAAKGVRAMASGSNPSSSGRGKKHEEGASASGEVPVEARKSEAQAAQPAGAGAEMQRSPSRSAARRKADTAATSAMAPFLGGGLASVLPRMMMTPSLPGMLSTADPFGSLLAPLRSGPFGLADRLLHDLEDDMRTITQSVLGGDVAEGGEEEGGFSLADVAPGRLWAAVDVKETPTEFVLSTDVPGLSKDDVKVTVQDGVLMIHGERKREETKEEEGFKRVERSYGVFERRFKLPANVSEGEGIKAAMDHGVLSVTLPKREEAKPKPISISVGGGAAGGEQGGAAGGEKAMEG